MYTVTLTDKDPGYMGIYEREEFKKILGDIYDNFLALDDKDFKKLREIANKLPNHPYHP